MLIPIGTVTAYAGSIERNLRSDLLRQGWVLCDGSMLDRGEFPGLFLVIGTMYGDGDGANTFNVPDYRGYFLRGVDDPDYAGGRPAGGRDPEASERRSPSTNESIGGVVGSVQGWATGKPKTGFKTGRESNPHSHAAETNARNKGGPNIFDDGGRRGMEPFGSVTVHNNDRSHTHTIEGGGDPETRPINIYVNYLIKALNTQSPIDGPPIDE